MKNKNLMLCVFFTFFCLLNGFSQSQWRKVQNVVTGENYLIKDGIKEDGSPDSHGFKIWKSGDSYYFTITYSGSYLNSTQYHDNGNIDVKIGNEWKNFWYKYNIKDKNPVWTQEKLELLKKGTIMKITYGSTTAYVQLNGLETALKSL